MVPLFVLGGVIGIVGLLMVVMPAKPWLHSRLGGRWRYDDLREKPTAAGVRSVRTGGWFLLVFAVFAIVLGATSYA